MKRINIVKDGRQEERRGLNGDGTSLREALELTNPRLVAYVAT